ncbi:GNAT family N-acetyltransferase [Butyrivibrio sp. AE3004]|uniref:GNAT family N-acetyltransferase n=1 Tax=Butyrivibrio sp. AE3004 TaxID=1506994 RepID=UPI00068EF6F2|nr:GNAT family N-acetyltransferase [Butyrivibrio sp. AE3004]
MKIKQLRSAEITTIYQERMVHDFIKDELKKLSVILKAVDDGIYECLGLFIESEIIGYAFLVKQGMNFLVDYLAVYPKYRNKGLGSEIIRLLREYMSGAGLIILEVEDPAYTKERDLKELQARRIGFYERNGCIDYGLRVRCFGVPFIILVLENNSIRSKEKLWEMYKAFYGAVFSRDIVEKNIECLGDEEHIEESVKPQPRCIS